MLQLLRERFVAPFAAVFFAGTTVGELALVLRFVIIGRNVQSQSAAAPVHSDRGET